MIKIQVDFIDNIFQTFLLRKEWIKKNIWIFVFDFLSKSAGYLFLPWYLAHMTQADFGLYTYLFYIITVSANVLSLGFPTSTNKLFFEYSKERGSYLYTSNLFIFLFLILLYLIFSFTQIDKTIISFLVDNKEFDYSNIRFYFLLYIFFMILYSQLSVYFQFSLKIKKFQFYNLIRLFLMNLVVVYFIYLNNTNGYITRIKWEVLLSLILFIPLVKQFITEFKVHFNWKMIKRSLLIGLPVIGSSIAALLYTISDKYFLQRYTSIDILAIYNLTLFLTMPIGFLFTTINLVWLPSFFKENDYVLLYKKTMSFLSILLPLISIIGLFIWLFIYIAIYFQIISNNYLSALSLFPFVAISVIIDGASTYLNNFIIIFEKTWISLLMVCIIGVLMFALSRWLVPFYYIQATVGILIFLSIVRFISLLTIVKVLRNKHKLNTNLLHVS